MESTNESRKASDGMVAWLVIAIVFFGAGFGVSRYTTHTTCAEKSPILEKRRLSDPEISENTAFRIAKSSISPYDYKTYIMGFDPSDSSLHSLFGIDDTSTTSIEKDESGKYVLTSVVYPDEFDVSKIETKKYSLDPSTIGYFEDKIFGFDKISNVNVAFHIGNIVRIYRGGTDGTVVFGVVDLEGTSIELLTAAKSKPAQSTSAAPTEPVKKK